MSLKDLDADHLSLLLHCWSSQSGLLCNLGIVDAGKNEIFSINISEHPTTDIVFVYNDGREDLGAARYGHWEGCAPLTIFASVVGRRGPLPNHQAATSEYEELQKWQGTVQSSTFTSIGAIKTALRLVLSGSLPLASDEGELFDSFEAYLLRADVEEDALATLIIKTFDVEGRIQDLLEMQHILDYADIFAESHLDSNVFDAEPELDPSFQVPDIGSTVANAQADLTPSLPVLGIQGKRGRTDI